MSGAHLLRRRDVTRGLILSAAAAIESRIGVASPASAGPQCSSQSGDAPWTEFGINIVGPALSPGRRGKYAKDYIYPAESSLAYYRSKGFRVARVTFLWERLQPQLFSELDDGELKRLRALVDATRRQSMVLITGPHNYARYSIKDGEPQPIGSDAVPLAAFVDLWRRLSSAFSSIEDGLIFTVMNEPHDIEAPWSPMAQAAVDAIRKIDKQRWLYIPGDNWSSARSWRQYNENLAISDPSDRIVYVAHQYFDASAKGAYERDYDADGAYPEIGVDRLKPFLEWLRDRKFRGTVTEYGVPNSDPRWLVVLDKALASLKQANVGGAYWAGGPWWGDYPLSSEPRDGHDAPVMSILTKYTERCSPSRSN